MLKTFNKKKIELDLEDQLTVIIFDISVQIKVECYHGKNEHQ